MSVQNAKAMTLMQACRDYFGLKQGQTSLQFGQEYKQLTTEDRQEMKTILEEQGYIIVLAGATEKVAEGMKVSPLS